MIVQIPLRSLITSLHFAYSVTAFGLHLHDVYASGLSALLYLAASRRALYPDPKETSFQTVLLCLFTVPSRGDSGV